MHREACENGGGGSVLSATLLTILLFPASIFQVYVSYDYGRSFKRISEKLNFGTGNSSEAVIAQFYHSPADNKRVRKSPLLTSWGHFGEGGWEVERLDILAV